MRQAAGAARAADSGAARPRRGALAAVAGALLLWIVYLVYVRRATGVYNDDDLGHYFMARDALHDPGLFLDVWGRPLFTLLYCLPAQLGYRAVALMTTLLTVATAWVTGRAGARLAEGAGPLAGGLLGTMPFVVLLAGASLTEPLCALLLALALAAWAAGARWRFALCAGLVPLARLELVVLVGGWAVWLAVRRRSWRAALPAGGGVLVWAVAGALVHGDPLWLLHRVLTGEANLYGATGFWHYPRGLIYVIGPVAFLFVLVDLVEQVAARRRLDLLGASAVGALGLYLLLSWKLSLGHAAGFLRHLVAVAPLFALLAARGARTTWAARGERRRPLLVLGLGALLILFFLSRALVMHHRAVGPFDPSRLLVALVVLGLAAGAARWRAGWRAAAGTPALLALALVYTLWAEPPLTAGPEQLAAERAFAWYAASPWAAAPVIATHPWIEFELERAGRRPAGGPPRVGRQAVAAAAPGTVIFWDSHYCLRAADPMTLRDFKFDPRFTMEFESIAADSSFVTYVLVKGEPQH